MRLLIFSTSWLGNRYSCDFHNGVGWVGALCGALLNHGGFEIGLSYEGNGSWSKVNGGIRLYPLPIFSSWRNRLKRKMSVETEERLLVPLMQKAIEDFKPDIIQVFGSENAFGTICQYTDIPCVIHIQGFLPAYANAYYPPGISLLDYCRQAFLKPGELYQRIWRWHVFRERAKREERILANVEFFLGRTEWDKAIVRVYSHCGRYFHCDEILRPVFYESKIWQAHQRTQWQIISVISMPIYKGQDLILKTANLLKNKLGVDFTWNVYGVYDLRFFEKMLGISAESVNVHIMGSVNAETLRDALLDADVYVHPSYIDNSPNSLCEAQMLGLPVIGADVGGVSTLVQQGVNGLLVPANDPIMLASHLHRLLINDHEFASHLGMEARQTALARHEPSRIVKDLSQIYQTVIQGD